MPRRRAPAAAVALLAVAVGGCGSPKGCLLEENSKPRTDFRANLQGLLGPSPCAFPTPPELAGEARRLDEMEGSLLGRIEASDLRGDLERARKEAEELSRNVFAQECAVWPQGEAALKAANADLAGREAALKVIGAEFEQLLAACRDG